MKITKYKEFTGSKIQEFIDFVNLTNCYYAERLINSSLEYLTSYVKKNLGNIEEIIIILRK